MFNCLTSMADQDIAPNLDALKLASHIILARWLQFDVVLSLTSSFQSRKISTKLG